MKAGRETEEWVFEVAHVGFEADFHHPLGADLGLAESVARLYEAEKDDAEIFIQNASATAFSSDELLNWFLLQSRTTLADHVPEGLLASGGGALVTFPLRFQPDTFSMDTVDGRQDLSALKLYTKVTARPAPLPH